MKNWMKWIRLFLLSGVVVVAAGCASTAQVVPMPDQSKTVEDASKARIYVVRPTSFGAAIAMRVSDGDKHIGHTGPNGYLCWERTPGMATIQGKAENTSTISLDCRRGVSYYIQQRVKMGWWFARNKLELLSEKEGKERVSKCKPAQVQ